MTRINNPFYGTVEIYGEADWRFVGGELNIPKAP